MPVRIEIDWVLRKARYTASGLVSDREFDRSVGDTIRENPELASFDSLVDLRTYHGEVSAQQVGDLALELNQIRPPNTRPARSAFVTFDANFAHWMEAMKLQFEGREFRLFQAMEAAEAWVMDDEAAGDA